MRAHESRVSPLFGHPLAQSTLRAPALSARLLTATLVFIAATTLAACSSTSDSSGEPEGPPPEELTSGSRPAVDTPEHELVSEGKRYFDAGVYSVAKDVFERLRDGYPLGAYAEFAEIKIADCEFESSNFAIAAALYEEFLKARPASRSTSYALLRAGRSNQLANRGVGRDDSTLVRAREFYQQLLTQYPTSPFAEGARTYLSQTDFLLAANEKRIIEFYKKMDKEPAFEARTAAFSERFGMDVEVVDEDQSLPPAQEPRLVAPVGDTLLVENDLGQASEAPARMARATRPQESLNERSASPTTRTFPFIRHVECDRAKRLVFLHLSKDLETPGLAEALSPLSANQNGFVFQVPGLSTPSGDTLERDCFGTKDVVISPRGEIRIAALARGSPTSATGTLAQVLELTSPPRIVVAIE